MGVRVAVVILALCACSSRARPRGDARADAGPRVTLVGATVVGEGVRDLSIEGRYVAAGAAAGTSVDVSGKFLVPAFIDSHVHLAYLPVSAELARRGVAGAVDMAAPLSAFEQSLEPLVALRSGPMLTAPGGYPTQSWGSGGYGREVASAEDARSAVDELRQAGAALIKIPLTSPPSLELETASAVAARAHELGLKLAAHALSDAEAALAASAGADVLAHTPTEVLSEATIEAFAGRAVVSTLAAFGGGAATVENLRRLREAGATVLYGTDLGNTRVAGIQADELELLAAAGLTPAEIIAAATSDAAAYWGLDELGAIAPGKRASFLVLASDPLLDPAALANPEAVYLDGERVAP